MTKFCRLSSHSRKVSSAHRREVPHDTLPAFLYLFWQPQESIAVGGLERREMHNLEGMGLADLLAVCIRLYSMFALRQVVEVVGHAEAGIGRTMPTLSDGIGPAGAIGDGEGFPHDSAP